jgi:diacylglycerol kinase
MTTSIFLDTQIRDWVLIPLSLVIFLIEIFRTYLSQLLQSDKKIKDLGSVSCFIAKYFKKMFCVPNLLKVLVKNI